MSTPVKSTFESEGSVETVFATLTDESWPQHKAERFGDGSRIERREVKPDGGLLMVVSRELPSGVPGFLEKFLPADGRVVQTDDWGPEEGGERRGVWKVEIPGAPARLGGTLLLEQVPQGSRYTIQGEVGVKVPLIGGKAEKFIAEMVHKLAAKECELLQARLQA
jgi:hypothetical protein